MDSLIEIIKNLKKEEIRNFKIFAKRFHRQEDIKITTLFDLIRAGDYETDEKAMISKLFPQDKDVSNAYYRLKNRLKTELEKSLLNLHHNLDEKIETINLITLSSIFSYKAQYDLSIYYLKKAEKTAIQNEYYDLLDFIYSQIIELSYNFIFDEINPLEYIEKRKENSGKNNVLMEANNAIAAVSYSLRKSNLSKASDVGHALQGTLEELNIASEIYKIPYVKVKISHCIRGILFQNKDFVRLESYLIDTYNDFEEEKIFTKSTHLSKITQLTWIVNTLMVNKKWDESTKYTEKLYDELHKFNKLYYDNFIWTYYQSLITNYISSNRLDAAILLLNQIVELPAHKGMKSLYEYAIYGNLALCYYFKGNTSEAIKVLARLFLKDIYPKLSTENQFSISIIEIILHYENKNPDYVTYRIGEIRRQFRTLLKNETFQDEKTFLKLLLNICNKADALHDKPMLIQMEHFASSAPKVQIGSGKYIELGLWVRSKLDKRHYYDYLYEALQA